MRGSAVTLAPETSDADREVLLSALTNHQLSGKHLEIGTAAGGTLRHLMLRYPHSERPQFVVVDPLTYFGNQREIVELNLVGGGIDPTTVDFRQSTSSAALGKALQENEQFSFIFIDAIHNAYNLTKDLAWTRMLEVGGIVAFHDYGTEKFPGVTWAVDRFLAHHKNYQVLEVGGVTLVARKTTESIGPEPSILDRALALVVDVLLKWRRSFRRRLHSLAN